MVVGVVNVDSVLSAKRAIATFEQSAGADSAPSDGESSGALAPFALLEVERLNLTVPVFLGTDALTLNRGAGVVEGTALPGDDGNIVISAHRDSFFRALKDIEVSDRIELRTSDASQEFRVEVIFTTDPLDVSVLDPTEQPTLTLITCYPFYYIGFAPERFIVRATAMQLNL